VVLSGQLLCFTAAYMLVYTGALNAYWAFHLVLTALLLTYYILAYATVNMRAGAPAYLRLSWGYM
jgi:hypothetical protein